MKIIAKEICDQYSEAELIRIILDDLDYFSCLYDRYESKLIRYIRRIAGLDREEAEDVLQDAFIKIWRNLNGIDPSLKLSSWIYRIVHNETISVWRKKRSFGKDRMVELPDDLVEDPSHSLDLKEEESKYLQAYQILEQLPPKYKSILVLKFLEGMTYEEISDVLKIPEGTVATRMNRAKKGFRKIAVDRHISFFD